MSKMIVIQGTVGAGKSTLCSMISAREGIRVYPEPVEHNPFLSMFYVNPERYAYTLQTYMLHARFEQMMSMKSQDWGIMDMSIYGNDIFTEVMYDSGYMSEDEYNLYVQMSNYYKSLIPKPTLMVYLQCSTYTCVKRLMQRGRPYELKTPLQYWYDLNGAYEKWYGDYKDSKKILINVDDLDIVQHEVDEDYLIDLVLEEAGIILED